MTPAARLLLTLLVLPLGTQLACGDKDKDTDDPKGDGGGTGDGGGDPTGDGGGDITGDGGGDPTGDGGSDGGAAEARSVRVHLSLHLREDGNLTQAIPEATLILQGSEGSRILLPEVTDESGQASAVLELGDEEWTGCWILPGETEGCGEPLEIDEDGEIRAWLGVDWDDSHMIKGRLTLGDGRTYCSGVGMLASCGFTQDAARPKVWGESPYYYWYAETSLTRPNRSGDYLLDGAARVATVYAEGGAGAEAEAGITASRAVDLSLPIPVPRLYSTLVESTETEAQLYLSAVLAQTEGDALAHSFVPPSEAFTALRSYSNGRTTDIGSREALVSLRREPGDKTILVCGETDHFLVACDTPRVYPAEDASVLLSSAALAGRRLSPHGEAVPPEGEEELLDSERPQAWLSPGFYWLNGPDLAPSSVHIPDDASASLLRDVAPCLAEAELADTALMERSSGGGATTWTASDGSFSLRIPDRTVYIGREALPDTAVPRLSIVSGASSQPLETVGQSPELSALSPLSTVWLSFDDEDGNPLDARIVPSDAPVQLKVALGHDWSGERQVALWAGPGPDTKLDEPVWQGTGELATVVDGYASFEVDALGWMTVAEPYSPGCVTVYADQWSGYTTVYGTWTSASGQTVSRSWPIHQAPIHLGGLPLGQSVTLSLGGVCEPDPSTARTVSVGKTSAALPWNLGPEVECTEVVLPELPTVPAPAWLTRHRLEPVTVGSTSLSADDLAQSYYDTIDPDGLATTLSDWKDNVCGWPSGIGDVQATYQNRSDLGFIRDMFSYTGSDGRVCMYVTNYADFAAFLAGQPIATVAMDWAPDPLDKSATPEFFTRFYVFDAAGTSRLTSIDLDGTGPRAVPQLCMNCHGGDHISSQDVASAGWSGWGDVGASFIPFDAGSYGYLDTLPGGGPSGIDAASQEAAFRELNEAVLRTLDDPETRSLVHLWYGSSASTTNVLPTTSPDFHAVPAGWAGSADDQDVYQDVVSKHCLLCHMSHADYVDFDSASELQQWGSMVHYDICEQRLMPHALRTFQNLYQQVSPHPTALLGDYLGTGAKYDPWADGCSF